MVAISGAIMPEPLAMPQSVTLCPSISTLRIAPLGNVSVVMMASAAGNQAFASSALCNLGNSARTFSTGNGSPITPVEAMKTRLAVVPSSFEMAIAVAFTASSPALPV